MLARMQFHFHLYALTQGRNSKFTQLHRFHIADFTCNLLYIATYVYIQIFSTFIHFGCFCFLCQLFSGGCINASPAGKRRIASGVEQQQFGDDSLFGISGKLSTANDGNGYNGFGRITPAITAIAIAACVLIVSVFAIVFVILQVRIIYVSFFIY